MSVALLLASALNALKAENMALQLTKTDGQKIQILLEKSPEITFPDEDTVHITTADGTLVYQYDELDSYRITGSSADASLILQDRQDVSIKLETASICLMGLPDGITVSLYSVDGTLCADSQVADGGICRISTAALSHGVYLVVGGEFKSKIIL